MMEKREPREDAKRQVRVKGTHEKSDLSMAGKREQEDKRGCRQKTVRTQSLQGIPEKKCGGKKKLESLQRGEGKK